MKSLFSVPILLSLFLVFPSHAQSHEIVLPLTINVNGTLMASDGEPKIIDGEPISPYELLLKQYMQRSYGIIAKIK